MRDDGHTVRIASPRHYGTAAVLIAVLLASGGCASVSTTPARLYQLDGVAVIHAELFGLRDGHGAIRAELPDGRAVDGRYALTSPGTSPPPFGLRPPADPLLWARVYGYDDDTGVHPAGYGLLTVSSGETLTAVFYRLDLAHGFGTGLARDSAGHWYRIYLGEVPR